MTNYQFYNYFVEDGQFTSEHRLNRLLGFEKDVIEIPRDEYGNDDDFVEAYVLFIQRNDVYCIGNIERDFPKSNQEYDSYRNYFEDRLKVEKTYQLTFYDSDENIDDSPIFVEAYSEEEALEKFKTDYPDRVIHQISAI